jgi:hypothetical protein
MKAYVINLDSRPQNMERVRSSMARLQPSLVEIERVPAVDMTGFDVRDPGRNAAKLELVRKHVSPTALLTMLRERRYHHEQFTTPGAIGCYLSHMNVWRKIAAAKEGALVIEDDAVVSDPEVMAQMVRAVQRNRLPPEVDVLLVGWANLMSVDDDAASETATAEELAAPAAPAAPAITLGPDVVAHRVLRQFSLALMYYVTPAGARKLLQTALPIEAHVDFYIGRRLDPQLSRLLGVEPLVVYGARRSRDGRSFVLHDNALGSAIQHGDCESCGPQIDLEVVVDERGRSRSVPSVVKRLTDPVLIAAALLMAIAVVAAVGALVAKAAARRKTYRSGHR